MSTNTGIEWTNSTWNPWHGCHKVSAGCKNCYMFTDKKRYGQDPNVVQRSKTKFADPLKWTHEPRLCFTCSWSDWFIEEADAWREEAYEIIRATPHITYQILTKRIERAVGRIPDPALSNIWLGVSVESKATKQRIDALRQLPAAVRFLSLEPLLEDLGDLDLTGISWVIVGGESGPGARPLNVAWARSIIQQCKDAGVAVFCKQLGAKPFDSSKELQQWPQGVTGGSKPDGWQEGCDLVGPWTPIIFDRKGGDMSEWEPGLRVRQFPAVVNA